MLFSTLSNLSAQSVLFSSALYDPKIKWRTIETEHFYIHFGKGLKREAKEMQYIVEEVHQDLITKINWKPKRKTDIVLIDNTDYSNGMATPFPSNLIILNIAKPLPGSILSNTSDYYRMLFVHEYTHILDLDMVHGCMSLTRYFPGRIWFPNIFQPIWSIEGHPVYQESQSGEGRNNSTYVDMIIRNDIYFDNFKSIAHASVFPRQWPQGSVPYIYGGRFAEFIDYKFGYGTMSKTIFYNSSAIPYFVNDNARKATGRSFLSLWD